MIRNRIITLLTTAALLLSGGTSQSVETTAGNYVNFSFDQVDIRLLVKIVGEMTGKRFVVDENVAGKVTIITPPRIPQDEVYPLFLSVIESSGFSVVEKNGAVHVVRLADAKQAGPPVVATEGGTHGGVITKVIKVGHISALELRRLLEPLVRGGKEGSLSAFGPTNHLIITDTVENIREIEKIIAEMDKPGAARVVEVIDLKHASAEEVAKQLVTAMVGAASAGEKIGRHLQQVADGAGGIPTDVVVVPARRANSLILVGTGVQLAEMKRIVEKMDAEIPSGYGRMNSIFLKYLDAEEASKNLNALLAKTTDKDQRNPIAIEHNIANNALIVDASPEDFEVIKKLVEGLDQIPQQVMVEVLIAEVAVGKNVNLGVQMQTIEQAENGVTTFLGSSRPSDTDVIQDFLSTGISPQGIAVGVARGTMTDASGAIVPRIPIVVQALAQNRDVKILSNIPLWAQNNTEATVSVVENIPILRSTIEGGAGTSRDVIQNIDRMDVGIKLKMTPHVNPDGQILLELNPSIEAIVDEGPEGQLFAPTIAKRELSTTVTVPDRATVVLTGLIREDTIKDVSKVPFLGDIPIIGWLFRSQSTRKQQTNLLIFVTPHIVTDLNVAMELKKNLEEKTSLDSGESMASPSEPVER